jgi:hypothetical protein
MEKCLGRHFCATIATWDEALKTEGPHAWLPGLRWHGCGVYPLAPQKLFIAYRHGPASASKKSPKNLKKMLKMKVAPAMCMKTKDRVQDLHCAFREGN